jgi:hypothetical protein
MIVIITVVALAAGSVILGQAPPATPPAPKTLAATMNVFAFPTKGQTPEVQSQDEAACYTYANQSTGTDPFALQKQAQQQQQKAEQQKQQVAASGQGAGAKGAVGGAAAGALIGEIASDDAGKGAAYGAAVGAVAGRRKAKKAKAEANAQIDQQAQGAQQATQAQMDNFKKAFSVCLEAKNYMVKY